MMKLLKIIGVGILVGYCYKKVKARKQMCSHAKDELPEHSSEQSMS